MDIPVVKNKEYVVKIIDNGFGGEGIAKIDNFTIFVPNTIKGEKVEIHIVKVLSSHAFGKVTKIILPSMHRVESDCATYSRCGGCHLRHVDYTQTLEIKRNALQGLVDKSLKNKIKIQPVIGMKNPYYYRNKVQFPVGRDTKGQPTIGVFANRTHEIIPIHTCLIQNQKIEEVAKYLFNYIVKNGISIYNEKTQKGLIRHIIIKIGIKTNEIMCIVVINGKEIPKEKDLITDITRRFPEVKTIVKNCNRKNTNVILGQENINLYGKGFITDQLGEYTFNISPLSFYQVNPIQAERLYQIAVEEANISKQDIVFDLYCGIGTISLFMSKFAKQVYGIEVVEEAVEMARENARQNCVDNVEFIAGEVENVLDQLIDKENIVPDIVMVDPPRRGLDTKSLLNLLRIRPKRFVYISCNPATLMRDLAKLEGVYCIKTLQPIDMFPFTYHVECVAVLQLKQDR